MRHRYDSGNRRKNAAAAAPVRVLFALVITAWAAPNESKVHQVLRFVALDGRAAVDDSTVAATCNFALNSFASSSITKVILSCPTAYAKLTPSAHSGATQQHT